MEHLRFIIRDKEAGNIIDSFSTLDEAKRELAKYEHQDKKEGSYEADFYEIYDSQIESIII